MRSVIPHFVSIALSISALIVVSHSPLIAIVLSVTALCISAFTTSEVV